MEGGSMVSRILFVRRSSTLLPFIHPSPISQTHRIPSPSSFVPYTFSSPPSNSSNFPFTFNPFSTQTETTNPEDVNEICRVLSDFRSPHNDIESALNGFSSKISIDLVEQSMKRCKNLSFSAQRFFLWARKLPGFVHSREAYHILIDILGSSKQFPLIWDLLSEMRENGDYEITPLLFWNIFRSYCRADLPMDAIRSFEKMVDFNVEPSVDDLDHLLYLLCKRKQVKFAQDFFDRVKFDFPPSPKSYSILMRGWGDLGESVEARKLFDEILQRGCSIDLVAYNTLLECLCRGGKGDEAYKLFKEMGLYGLKADASTYSVFIRASCEANDVRSALRILDRTKRYDLKPNVFTYGAIIKLFLKNQLVDDAYTLLDEMVERGVSPDVWSYNAILAFHCDHSEVNKALRLINRMDKYCCLGDRHTYNMLLKMLIRLGRFDRATQVWESMEQSGFCPSVSTYAVMIHGLCKKRGKLEDACRYFEMMIDEGLPPYSATCELLKDRLLQFGFGEKTQILSDKMLQSTSCSIQELSRIMSGEKVRRESSPEEEKSKWYENNR